MNAAEPWFLSERAEALAALYLTRHKALGVIPVSRHDPYAGYDLLVRIRESDGQEVASFGVEVKGVIAAQLRDNDVEQGVFTVPYTSRAITASQLPVCVFVFAVDTEMGFYRWLHKPIFSTLGNTYLEPDEVALRADLDRNNQIVVTSKFEKLTDLTISLLIRAVSVWYEARRTLVS